MVSKRTMEPVRPGSGSRLGITPGRTVDIWGRCSVHMMVAIRLPPKAGRVIISCLSSDISSFVQSAVRPVARRAESLGARSRPMVVAPKSTISGRMAVII